MKNKGGRKPPTQDKPGMKRKDGKGNVDAEFLRRIIKLIKIVIPSFTDSVLLDFAMLNICLVLRTVLSISISGQNGSIVKSIIQAKYPVFLQRIGTLALYALPASFVNSYLEYLNKKIALRFRENLCDYFHERYIDEKIFYQVSTIDARISSPDQRLTEDIDKWAHALSQLYSNFSKPLLDIILFSRKLSELLGWIGPISLISWYFVSAVILKFISPAFGKLTAVLQKMEGEFRGCHTNLSQHSEEIAFYRGHVFEQKQANSVFMVNKYYLSMKN
jgi:ATP-binding cassette, subfamily D (ALD), member 3